MSFCWEGKIFSLVLETDFGIATIASSVDLAPWMRRVEATSDFKVESGSKKLDCLIEGPALTDVVERKNMAEQK